MKISVIVPVYNVEKYIERCVQSILDQSLQDFEIIIVNDATLDNSMLIVQKYAEQDHRIKIVENPQNMGSMWTRRVGYQQASGDYFVFCDSDDYLPKNALEILYDAITGKKADIVVGSFQMVSDKGKGVVKKRKLSYGTDSISVYKSLLDGELFPSLCGKIFDRKNFENSDYETFAHQIYGEDAMLLYQIVDKIKKMAVIDDVVYCYWLNEASCSHAIYNEERTKSTVFAWNYIYNLLKDKRDISEFVIKSDVKKTVQYIKNGHRKDIIIKYSINPTVVSAFGLKTLSHYYSGFKLLYVYYLLNYKGFVWFCNIVKSIYFKKI